MSSTFRVFISLLVFGLSILSFSVDAKSRTEKKSVKLRKEKKKKLRVKYRKVQKLDFSADSLNGVARNPMGSYVREKKTQRYLPLYKVKKKMQKNSLELIEYSR